jgi:hypothetical protein
MRRFVVILLEMDFSQICEKYGSSLLVTGLETGHRCA